MGSQINDFINLISGGLAGAIAGTFVAPIERVIVLKQTALKNAHTSFYYNLKNIYQQENIRGFFKGNLVNMVRVIPFTSLEFYYFEKYRRIIQHHKIVDAAWSTNVLASSFAGMTALTLTYPLDTIRTLFSASNKLNNLVDIQNKIQQEGIKSLYRGLPVGVLGVMPYTAIKFSTFEYFRFLNFLKWNENINNLIYGAMSGIIAVTVGYPFNLLRKKSQISQGESLTTIIKETYKNSNIRGFYYGLSLVYLKIVPYVSFTFAINNYIKKGLLKKNEK